MKSYTKKKFIQKRIKSFFIFLMVAVTISCTFPLTSFAKEDDSVSKLVHVVYDDSRSMYLNNETRWCQAKYAMEVFCAMMSDNDVMNIYSMNSPDILTVYGNDKENVKKVHAMTSTYSSTPFDPVLAAGNELKNAADSYEKWLVILTDGSFDNTSVSKVQGTLDDYSAGNMNVVYIAIGSGAVTLKGNDSTGFYTETAVNTTDILESVTKIGNQIFEYQVLGDQYVKNTDTQSVLSIDIPTDQIIVFAQGENANIGTMSLNGNELSPSSVKSVNHSGDVMPLNSDDVIKVDTSLHGVVATFEAGDKPFESGEFAVEVSGASTVEYYYRPKVTVDCNLVYNGQTVQSDDELYAGDYDVTINFLNPLTGLIIQSDLLSDAIFTLEVVNNGKTQTIANKTGSVTLEEGEVDLKAVTELTGNVFLRSSNSYTVLPKAIEIIVEAEVKKDPYLAESLGQTSNPVIISVTNPKTNSLITEAQWNLAELSVEEKNNITWDIKKGSEVGTWELRPCNGTGKVTDIQTLDGTFNVNVNFQEDTQYAFGSTDFTIALQAYSGSELKVAIKNLQSSYDVKEFEDKKWEDFQAIVEYKDPVTGEFLPITQDMWNSFSADIKSDGNIGLTIEKSDTVGTWNITPSLYMNDPVLTNGGTYNFDVTVKGDVGELTYFGSDSGSFDVIALSLMDKIKRLLPLIIGFSGLIFLIVCYARKKRLKLRGLDPRCRFKNNVSAKIPIKKDFLSVISPFGPEKAVVKCSKPAFQCNFPNLKIVAAGGSGRSFKIANKNMSFISTKIGGERIDDMKKFKAQIFNFGNFEITSVDTKRSDKPLGEFTFK